jgi:phage-related tail protein
MRFMRNLLTTKSKLSNQKILVVRLQISRMTEMISNQVKQIVKVATNQFSISARLKLPRAVISSRSNSIDKTLKNTLKISSQSWDRCYLIVNKR